MQNEIKFTNRLIFNRVLMNPEICRELIEILLKIKVEKIEYIETEKSIEVPYQSHGIRLDVYVKDSNKIYDIELQTYDDDIPHRMRYYQGLMDTDSLLKGQNYTELKESFVIFICTYDPFGLNQPCYVFQNQCLIEETNLLYQLNDGAKKIVFNATAYEKEKDVEIKDFLKYTYCDKSSGKFTAKIDETVNKLKRIKSVREEAMFLSDELQHQRYMGRKEGIMSDKRETALRMLKRGRLSVEEIAEYSGLTIEEVTELQKDLQS